jgi:predicted deacetylase
MKEIIILLRFDDICPTMNWEQWGKAKRLLDAMGKTALLGVIPDCQDKDLLIDAPREDYWENIKELQKEGYTIAMHGYQHVFDIHASGIATPKKHSEFAGHPYEVQFDKIKKGKELLRSHGIETEVFFAPAHSYDVNTLKALAANGFKYISDGLSNKPYMRNGITCLPARTGGIPRIKGGGLYTAVIHAHEWAWKDKAYSWSQFEKICQNHANEIVDFDSFKDSSRGLVVIQRGIEKYYKFLLYKIVPLVNKIRQFIKH